jgi:hypothetical protein
VGDPRGWSRQLWGVVLTSGDGDERPMLIGSLWHRAEFRGAQYSGEPPRALLFTTRQEARTWCTERQAEYAARPETDPARHWRFRPVRVRETVTVERVNA